MTKGLEALKVFGLGLLGIFFSALFVLFFPLVLIWQVGKSIQEEKAIQEQEERAKVRRRKE